MRAEDWIVDVDIKSLIGAGTRSGVGAHDGIGLAEIVPKRNLERVVMVFASVEEDEIAGGGGIPRVVDEPVRAMAAQEFCFQVNGLGKFFFYAEAPVKKSRRFKSVVVD